MDEVLRAATSRVLKHEQVREYVRALVTGEAPGAPAPSERELVHRFGVARMTVRQAMDALVVEGLLERIPGRGTFVARPKRGNSTVLGFTEDMARRGLQTDSKTLLARREQAGPGVARALGVHEGDSIVHWRRLRHADGTSMCVEDAYLIERLFPDFLPNGTPASLYEYLRGKGLAPTWAEDSVAADIVTAEEALLLEVEPGSPVLRTQRRALSGEKVVEISRTVYRADRYTFRVQLCADD